MKSLVVLLLCCFMFEANSGLQAVQRFSSPMIAYGSSSGRGTGGLDIYQRNKAKKRYPTNRVRGQNYSNNPYLNSKKYPQQVTNRYQYPQRTPARSR